MYEGLVDRIHDRVYKEKKTKKHSYQFFFFYFLIYLNGSDSFVSIVYSEMSSDGIYITH